MPKPLELGPLPLDAKDILLDSALRAAPVVVFRSYIYLICEQWEGGALPANLKGLAQLSRCTPTIFKRKVWPHLGGYFQKTTINKEDKLIEPVSYGLRLEAVKRAVKRERQAEKQRQYWADKKAAEGE